MMSEQGIMKSLSKDLIFDSEYTRGIDHVSFDSSWSRASQYRNAVLCGPMAQDGETSFAFEIPVHGEGLQNAVTSFEDEATASISTRPAPNSQNFESPNDHRWVSPGGKGWPRQRKKSRNNIFCPSLPVGIVKKLASSFARSSGTVNKKVQKDTLGALIEAGDWFLEQIGNDLGTFAEHAGRKTIDATDVTILMKRFAVSCHNMSVAY